MFIRFELHKTNLMLKTLKKKKKKAKWYLVCVHKLNASLTTTVDALPSLLAHSTSAIVACCGVEF